MIWATSEVIDALSETSTASQQRCNCLEAAYSKARWSPALTVAFSLRYKPEPHKWGAIMSERLGLVEWDGGALVGSITIRGKRVKVMADKGTIHRRALGFNDALHLGDQTARLRNFRGVDAVLFSDLHLNGLDVGALLYGMPPGEQQGFSAAAPPSAESVAIFARLRSRREPISQRPRSHSRATVRSLALRSMRLLIV